MIHSILDGRPYVPWCQGLLSNEQSNEQSIEQSIDRTNNRTTRTKRIAPHRIVFRRTNERRGITRHDTTRHNTKAVKGRDATLLFVASTSGSIRRKTTRTRWSGMFRRDAVRCDTSWQKKNQQQRQQNYEVCSCTVRMIRCMECSDTIASYLPYVCCMLYVVCCMLCCFRVAHVPCLRLRSLRKIVSCRCR